MPEDTKITIQAYIHDIRKATGQVLVSLDENPKHGSWVKSAGLSYEGGVSPGLKDITLSQHLARTHRLIMW